MIDDFPKIGMVVDDNGTIEDKWGIEIAWERSNPHLTHPDTGVVLAWHGLHRGKVARCDYNYSHDIKYYLDYRTLTKATDEEYVRYKRKMRHEIDELLEIESNARNFLKGQEASGK